MLLPTTVVGSFPKPDYLKEARVKYSKREIDELELRALTKKATSETVHDQIDAGVDIISDGEMDRGDMVNFFAKKLDGFKESGLVRSYENRYYHKPIVIGKVKFKEGMGVELFRYAREISNREVKAIFTGPYTMMEWSFNEHYSSRRELLRDLSIALHQEALEFESAGAKYIQIDEPAIPTKPKEIDLAFDAMKTVIEGIRAKTISHMCYGDFEYIYPKILELGVDQLDLEFANRNYELLEIIKKHRDREREGEGEGGGDREGERHHNNLGSHYMRMA